MICCLLSIALSTNFPARRPTLITFLSQFSHESIYKWHQATGLINHGAIIVRENEWDGYQLTKPVLGALFGFLRARDHIQILERTFPETHAIHPLFTDTSHAWIVCLNQGEAIMFRQSLPWKFIAMGLKGVLQSPEPPNSGFRSDCHVSSWSPPTSSMNKS